MKIQIKTFMNIPEIPSEVQMEKGTLRDLIAKIFGKVHFKNEIIDSKTGEVRPDAVFEMRLNDVPYYSLGQGLETKLHDGDIITLSLILLGGG